MYNRSQNVSDIRLRREDGSAPTVQAIGIGQTFGPVRENREVSAEMWKETAAVYETLWYVFYQYLQYVNSKLKNNAMHT